MKNKVKMNRLIMKMADLSDTGQLDIFMKLYSY